MCLYLVIVSCSRDSSVEGNQNLTMSDQNIVTFSVNGVSFKMIQVHGGTFTMGATNEQIADAYENEKPPHPVTLSSFSIGETEVTQSLWRAVMERNPSHFSGSIRPVENVSWDDCMEFITNLNALTGESFRLPTEAEWEFAARGGNESRGYKYSGSNTIDDVAWYIFNSNSATHNVATKQPNELGIYDMSGNVSEWCSDSYSRYSSSAQSNPVGSGIGNPVFRGGYWNEFPKSCRNSSRNYGGKTYRNISHGVRLAL